MDTRSHETQIEIDAPIEEVWRAITEAREIEKWFAPKAEVTPGVGGKMFGSWGPGMEGTQLIEVWEPNRHLRLIEERDRTFGCAGTDSAKTSERVRLVVDYYLESNQGKTTLRLVHSGFGASSDWDGEYDGTRQGWPGFFRVLKYTLEHQAGKPVRSLNFFHTVTGGDAPTLHVRLRDALDLRGATWLEAPGFYQGVMDSLGGALVTLAASQKENLAHFYVNLTLYATTDEQAARIERQWKEALEALS